MTQQVAVLAKYSRLQTIAARVGITLAALGLFFLIRQDVLAWTWNHARSFTTSTTHRLRSPSIISAYLRNNTIRRLQLGAGGFSLPGWLNTDIEPGDGQAFLDATEHFPLPDSSFQLVFSEQVIEHLSYDQGLAMMQESFRILQHGGKVRLATPNLLKLADLLREDKTPEQEAYIRAKTDWHNWKMTADPASVIFNSEMTEFGHRFVYTPTMLKTTMAAAGFTQIRQYESGESDDPELKGIEVRSHLGGWSGGAAYKVRDIDHYETMVFEGVRQ